MGRHVARMEEGRSAFKIVAGKPTEKRPLGRPSRRWDDNLSNAQPMRQKKLQHPQDLLKLLY